MIIIKTLKTWTYFDKQFFYLIMCFNEIILDVYKDLGVEVVVIYIFWN